MNRNFPHLLWLFGLLLLLFTFVYFGPDGLPYQDPTDELLEQQARQMQKLTAFLLTSLCLFIIGAGWAFTRWIWNKRTRTQLLFTFLPLLIWTLSAGWFEWSWYGVDPMKDTGKGFAAGFIYQFWLPIALFLAVAVGFVSLCAKCSKRDHAVV